MSSLTPLRCEAAVALRLTPLAAMLTVMLTPLPPVPPGPDIGADAYALGRARYLQGDFTLARAWLNKALRYRYPAAAALIMEMEMVANMLDSIDLGEAVLAIITGDDDPFAETEEALRAAGEELLPEGFYETIPVFEQTGEEEE